MFLVSVQTHKHRIPNNKDRLLSTCFPSGSAGRNPAAIQEVQET